MPTYNRPGVYINEVLNPTPPIASSNSASIAAFIGANDRGPTTPTLVTSWSQYQGAFGLWNTVASNALPLALYTFFSNGGAQAYVSRVIGTGSVSSLATFLDSTPATAFILTALNAGAWGNGISIGIAASGTNRFDLTVYFGGTTSANVVERFTDLSVLTSDPRFIVTAINGASNYVTAAAGTSVTTPVATGSTPVTLATGVNGAAVAETDVAASVTSGVFDRIPYSLVLNPVGVTTAASVNFVISYATTRGDIFVVVDPLNDTAANQLVRNLTYTPSSFAAVYFPQITINDPTTTVIGATKAISPSGSVVGRIISTDTSRGVFKAAAGLQARVAGAVSVPVLTNAELDALNTGLAPANAIKYVPGAGIVIMGARTLQAGYISQYIPVRRSLIYLEKALADLTQFAVFEPNDSKLWRQITGVVTSFLIAFWGQGGLKGNTPSQAFFVKCDADTNPILAVNAGEVHLSVGVSLQRPAEFVVINIGQFDGGTIVTVA